MIQKQLIRPLEDSQKTGTNCFSGFGKQTGKIYMAFGQPDPIELDEKLMKRKKKSHTDFNAGIVSGYPSTREQQLKYEQKRQKMIADNKIFMQKLSQRSVEEEITIPITIFNCKTQLKSQKQPVNKTSITKNYFQKTQQSKNKQNSSWSLAVNRELALKVINFPCPQGQAEWNNGVQRYYPNKDISLKKLSQDIILSHRTTSPVQKVAPYQHCKKGIHTLASLALQLNDKKHFKSSQVLGSYDKSNTEQQKIKFLKEASVSELVDVINQTTDVKQIAEKNQWGFQQENLPIKLASSTSRIFSNKDQSRFEKSHQTQIKQSVSEINVEEAYIVKQKHVPTVNFQKVIQRSSDIFSNSPFIKSKHNKRVNREEPEWSDLNGASTQRDQQFLRSDFAPDFNKMLDRRWNKSFDSDNVYYDGAEQAKLKSQKVSIPDFKKVLSRDNLVYRINEGYNLDDQTNNFFRNQDKLKKLYSSSKKTFILENSNLFASHRENKSDLAYKMPLEEKILRGYFKL